MLCQRELAQLGPLAFFAGFSLTFLNLFDDGAPAQAEKRGQESERKDSQQSHEAISQAKNASLKRKSRHFRVVKMKR